MQIQVISINKLSNDFSAIASSYIKMIRWSLKNIEIVYSKRLPESQVKLFEAQLINKYIGKSSYKIVLDIYGK